VTGLVDKSGGTGYGLNISIPSTDATTGDSLCKAMTEVAEWITATAGCFLGHVKIAITTDPRTITFNLTDLETGVERHDTIPEGVHADVRFMAAVVDVDKNELAEKMSIALTTNGFKVNKRGIIELR